MTLDEAQALLQQMVDLGPQAHDEPEAQPLFAVALSAITELKRFREREPLVQQLREAARGPLQCSTCTGICQKCVDDLENALGYLAEYEERMTK